MPKSPPIAMFWPKMEQNPGKTGKTRKKPVETLENTLTNLSEKPKVNCGTVSPHPHEHW
jgi:hypothetical protein